MKSRTALLLSLILILGCDGSEGVGSGFSATPSGVTYEPMDFVTGDAHRKIYVEVDSIGSQANAFVFESVRNEVGRLGFIGALGKPDGVQIIFDDVLPREVSGSTIHSVDDVKALVAEYRSLEPPDDAAGLYFLMIDGTYEEDTEDDYALGFSFGGSAIAIFRENVLKAADKNGLGANPTAVGIVTSSLIIHEFGHILGLVNNGIEMEGEHQDEEHGAHCTDEQCIMHWEAHRPKLAAKVGGSEGPDGPILITFCPKCIADLMATAGD